VSVAAWAGLLALQYGVAVAYLVITIPAGIALGVIERKIEVKR